jgi:hypothetical protein
MQSSAPHVLAFDIGIRNLAWCLMKKEESAWTILGWDNYDLLAGNSTQSAKDARSVLCACKKKATYVHAAVYTCVKCSPSGFPPLRDLSGNLLKKIPALETLRKMCEPFHSKKKDKKSLLELLETKYSLPYVIPKATRSKTEDLAMIHTSIQQFVDKNAEMFQKATHILLENQPAFKNPTMKSVQILVFATLRDRLSGERYVGFVHAGKKGAGSDTTEKGDKGYGGRKKASELRAVEFLEKNTVHEKETWKTVLKANQKKSDLCDAMCMCIDKLGARQLPV